jgi:Uncharacterized conserved protein
VRELAVGLSRALRIFIVEEVLLDGQVVPTSITNKPLPKITSKSGPWVWLIVEKGGVDAITLLLMLSKRFGVGARDIGFGGFKDAVAVTSQIISVRGISIDDVPRELGKNVRILGAFNMDRAFTTSDIWGNEFTIRIRDVHNQYMERVQCTIELTNPPTGYVPNQRTSQINHHRAITTVITYRVYVVGSHRE